MKIDDNNLNVAQDELFSVAHRALPVLDEHEDASAALRAQAPSCREVLRSFLDAYTHKGVLVDAASEELEQAKEHIRNLRGELGVWLAVYSGEDETFDPTPYRTGSNQYERTMHASTALMRRVRESQSGPSPLPYEQELHEALEPVVAEAWSLWRAAQRTQAGLQEHRAITRHAARAAHRKLVALRRTLKALLGARHRDYRRIAMARSASGAVVAEAPEPAMAEAAVAEAEALTLPAMPSDNETEAEAA
jgi:hypothetical protein